MNRLFIRISAAILGLAAASCADDKFYLPGDPGEGEADIAVTATFKSYGTALDESRTLGNTLDGIDNLSVFVYDQNGENLIERHSFTKEQLTSKPDNTDKPADGEGVDVPIATSKVSFQLPKLNYGKYKIYVVANADMSDKDVSTEEKLKSITFEWDSENIAANKQMFGWFEDKDPGEINAKGLNAPVVTINRPNMMLNAWLVRLASKVTVAYDATNLKEDVTIYLQDVRIKDIPAKCALGLTNTPKAEDDLIKDGEIIKYYEGEAPNTESFTDSWPAILVKNSKFGSDHTHDANALFFYENMQGTGVDKAQDVDGDGKIDSPDSNNPDDPDYKDQKKFGTYIEVTAYYESKNPARPGKGKIVYRFMLGKDVRTNYDAQRNYHYKLTLKFNGWANDVDWHIDFEPDPEMKLPNPYFISYLYDKSAVIPVEITGKIQPGTKLKAEIIENGWWPVVYNEETGEITDADPDQFYNGLNADETKKVWNGFLSLRNTGHTTDIAPGALAGEANAINKDYWEKNQRGEREYETSVGTHPDAKDGDYSVEKDPSNEDVTIFNIPYYTRAKNLVKNSGYTGNNPYVSYQRRAIVRFTATILNPVTGKYQDYSEDVNIIQVRRIVNPKGIWRAHNETGNFLVHLMRLETEYTPDPWTQGENRKFQDFKSIGPWSAEVMVEGAYRNGANSSESWINLTTSGDKSTTTQGENGKTKIIGESGSSIEFNYAPNGSIGADEVRYGIIKVRYHNYTCEHLIFVRQGYAPIPVASNSGATKWYSFNLTSGTEMATSPCDEGSLFKRFNTDVPIRPENNIKFPFQTTLNANLTVNYKPYGTPTGNPGVIWLRSWDNITTPAGVTKFADMKTRSSEPSLNGIDMRVATVDDYLELYNDPNVQFGFGILYDGTATGVQESVKDAYSYYGKYLSHGTDGSANYEQNTDIYKAGRGMRGCFVYNEQTGAQLFLPIGAAGYGRRKQNPIYSGTFSPGMLIYANRNQEMQENNTDVPWQRPILWDLYQRPGAIYWCNEMKEGEVLGNGQAKDCVAWDFNYITFDFFPISKEMVLTITKDQSGKVTRLTPTDALRIRCVVPGTSKKPSPPQTE